MVVLEILAAIGVVAIFIAGYWLVTSKFPNIGEKLNKFVSDVGSSLKKKKKTDKE